MYCHKCGKEIPQNANFCIFCGSEIIRINQHSATNIMANSEDFISKEHTAKNSNIETVHDSVNKGESYSLLIGLAYIIVILVYGLLSDV